MVQPDRCPACGAERPANAHQGACPCCLMQLGLDDPVLGLSCGGTGVTTGPAGDRAGAGVLATLAASLGPIPGVLLRDTEAAPEPILRPLATASSASLGGYGRLQLLGEIARGGMGAVLKGRDADLGRELAVKVLLDRHRDDPDLVRRFVEEAQIAGQLQHPGIVPVYELGAFADRRPFFTMKLVKGSTLAEILRDRPAPGDDLPRLLTVCLQVTQTMAYAHARGVIHRDLKPSNVMVGSFGEVQVMDWGLAKVLPRGGAVDDATAGRTETHETVIATARSGGDDSDLSRAGSVLGTPAYMAPEQARGEVRRLDERCDVFALGSILCEVLTGAPAFTGRTSGEVQRKAARGAVTDALTRLDAGGADPELRALTADCLAPEAEDRPRDAGVVAERLSAHLAGVQERLRAAELARAAEESRAQEAVKSAEAAEARAERRARRLTFALAVSVVCLIGAGAGGYAWEQRQATARAARAAVAVDAALAEADRAAVAARAAPAGTEAGWPEAVALAQKADDLGRHGDADEPTQRRAAAAVDRLKRERAEAAERGRLADFDRRLVRRLLEARLEMLLDMTGTIANSSYGDAFREAGFDPDGHPAEAGAALRARPTAVVQAAAAALDAWASSRRYWQSDDAGAARLAEAARVADPDPWRCDLRDALELPDRAARLARLRGLAEEARPDVLGPISLQALARALDEAADRSAAERLLVSAQRRYPGDAWINLTLASYLARREEYREAIPYYFAARVVHPESAFALGNCFEAVGKDDEAETVYRDLVRLQPPIITHLHSLAQLLRAQGRAREAAATFDATVARAHELLRQRPDRVNVQLALVWVLMMQGRFTEAEAASREVVRRVPSALMGHGALEWALAEQRRYAEAEAEAREMVRLKPDFWIGFQRLGTALCHQGRLEEALTAYRRAQVLLGMPGTAVATDLATLTRGVERQLALAHRLPAVLIGDDRPKDAAEGLDLGVLCLDRDRPVAATRLIADAIAADPGRADARPDPQVNSAWRIDMRNYGPPRYVAARAAALAGTGQGHDAPSPDDPARARLRSQALAYLRQELDAGVREVDPDQPASASWVRDALIGWYEDPDLVAVRQPEALATLPEAERSDCQSFWDEVDALLQRAAKARR